MTQITSILASEQSQTLLFYNTTLLIPISCDPVINGKEDLDVQRVFSWLEFLLIYNCSETEKERGTQKDLTQLAITIVTKTSVFHYAVFHTWNSFLICPLS